MTYEHEPSRAMPGRALRRVLGDLARFEDLTRMLYEAYADLFPESRDFWLRLAIEEAGHYQAVKGLIDSGVSDDMLVDADQVVDDLFLTELAKAAALIGEPVTNTSERTAVANAIEVERTPGERRLFDILASNHGPMADLVKRLSDDYDMHIRRLEERWESLGNL